MFLHDAIEDHMDLHNEVESYAGKPNGALKAEDVQKVDQCALGKWLPDEGAAHQAHDEYSKLTDAHVAFHSVCADTLRHADEGTLPKDALDAKGELTKSLVNLCAALSKLNVRIQVAQRALEEKKEQSDG